jgi:hypothetical protein
MKGHALIFQKTPIIIIPSVYLYFSCVEMAQIINVSSEQF